MNESSANEQKKAEVDKIHQLAKALKLNLVTNSDIETFLSYVLSFVTKVKTDMESVSKEHIAEIEKGVESLKEIQLEAMQSIDTDSENFKSLLADKLGEIENKLGEIRAIKLVPGKDGKTPVKGQDYFDGKDAEFDQESIMASLMQKIESKIPEKLDIDGIYIVTEINKLSTDDDDFKIDASHIKNWPKIDLPKMIAGGARFLTQLFDVALANPQAGDLLQFNGTKWINTPFDNNGILSLNGLTVATQTFTTGTSGTDFNIASSGTVHTFNIPSASSANRGLLTTAAFNSFAAKQAALVSGTNIKTINGNTILGSGNLVIPVTTPGGPDMSVQLNNLGAFDGDIDFTWNSSTKVLFVGDYSDINNGNTFTLDNNNNQILFDSPTGQIIMGSISTGTFYATTDVSARAFYIGNGDNYFGIDLDNRFFYMGDRGGVSNSTYWGVDDNNIIISGHGNNGTMISLDGNNMFYEMGDVDDIGEGTKLSMADGNGTQRLIGWGHAGVDITYDGGWVGIADNTIQSFFGGGTTLNAQINTNVLALVTAATGDDIGEYVVQDKVLTTNATDTTIHTLAIPASTTYAVEVIIVARRTGGTGGTAEDGGRIKLSSVYKNVAGTATLIGSQTNTPSDFSGGYTAKITVSGSNILIRVTGVANVNVSWVMTARVYLISS